MLSKTCSADFVALRMPTARLLLRPLLYRAMVRRMRATPAETDALPSRPKFPQFPRQTRLLPSDRTPRLSKLAIPSICQAASVRRSSALDTFAKAGRDGPEDAGSGRRRRSSDHAGPEEPLCPCRSQRRPAFTGGACRLPAGTPLTPRQVKATVFLKDLGDFAAVNKLYEAHFAPTKPARSCVEVCNLF
jgi:hypothetical protein